MLSLFYTAGTVTIRTQNKNTSSVKIIIFTLICQQTKAIPLLGNRTEIFDI